MSLHGPDPQERRSASTHGSSLPLTVQPRDFPTNRGGLCSKGWSSAEVLDVGGRVLAPRVRAGSGRDGSGRGEWRTTSWEEALDVIAGRLRRIRAEHGADAVGVFGGGGLTNEKAYQLGKFARLALGTRFIDYNGRFCMSSAAAAGTRAFGIDRGMPFPLTDLDDAQAILLLGSNVAATMPPFLSHLQQAREAGGLMVVDPRRSATARQTDDGQGLHVQAVPGTDLPLLLGLIHIAFADGWVDEEYVAGRTSGADALRRSVSSWWPERVQATTGVPVEQQREIVRRLATGPGSYILTGRGVEQHVDGTDTATAAINLALVLGLVGRPGAGYGTLTGQGNGQGGREHGQKADQLPGYRKITDPLARQHVAAVWGVEPDIIPGPGVGATQLLEMAGQPDGLRALLVHGANITVSAPDVDALKDRLRDLDLMVVCDFVMSETAQLADVVLPVTQWAEEEGTMTNLEGRVLRRRQARQAPGQARSELWIMHELARRLEAPGTFDVDPAAVFDELARASQGGLADYSGLSHALIDDLQEQGKAAYWPYPDGSTGTPRLFSERFAHQDGRARIVPVRVSRPEQQAQPLSANSITLITGRLLEHYQSGAQTRRVAQLAAAHPDAELEIHPATAERLHIADGALVDIANERANARCRARVTTDIRPDTVFMPFHFAGSECANLLTQAVTDPISGMPEFKRTNVTVTAVSEVPA